jgi:hypothetical protein
LKIYALRATIGEIINYCEAEKSREGHPQAEGTELGRSSEGDLSYVIFCTLAHRLLDRRQVLH